MWIFLGILGFIALLITVILLLPVFIIIKSDDDGEVIILYKILFKTFGENPDPNNPITKALKKATGVDVLENGELKKQLADKGFQATLARTVRMLWDLFKEIINLLKYCTVKKMELDILTSSKDAAETAINYGICCSTVYPLIGFINSELSVKPKGRKINISSNFKDETEWVKYNFVLTVQVYHLIAALFRVSLKEARREVDAQNSQNQPS